MLNSVWLRRQTLGKGNTKMKTRAWKIALVALLVIGLLGCIADQEHKNKQENPVKQEAPTVSVNVPPNQTVDTDKLKKELVAEVQSSNNNTQNQMSGLFNASLSKLAERITGLEASISATMTNTAVADLKAELKAVATATANLRAEFDTNVKMTAKLDAVMTAVANMQVKFDRLEVVAQGQAGLMNKIEEVKQDIKNTAGRDVNYMPKEAFDTAVLVTESNNKLWAGILGGIMTLAGSIAAYAYKNARAREQATNHLLMQALSELHPDQARTISANLPK